MDTVLVIDDERNIRTLVARVLAGDDVEVHTAGTGKEGLEMAEQLGGPDVALVDLRLPDLDGIPADSDEALVLLCPVLGPSATLVLHRLARYASAGPTTWEPSVFASTFGMSKNSATGLATKAIARLARFGFATIGSSALAR